jgi:predicted dehydrogenase
MKYLLIIGQGSIAKKHLIVLKKINKEIKVFFVKTKNKFKAEKLMNSLIAKYDLKLALICSPADTHLNYINFFKKKKINYLVEKPLIKDNQLNKLNIKKYKKTKITELVGYQLRFNKILLRIKKILSAKKIGKINNVKIFVNSFLPNWRKENYKKSLSLSKEKGGGVLLELSHEIDYMIWLLGKPEYLYAIIDKNNLFKKNLDEKVCIFFYYKNKSIQLDMSLNSRIEKRGIIINGSNGAIEGDLIKKKLTYIKSNKKIIILNSDQTNIEMLKDQMNFFLNSVKKNKKINNINQSLDVIKIISLIRKSNLLNKKLKI